jgi:hypothetical protein
MIIPDGCGWAVRGDAPFLGLWVLFHRFGQIEGRLGEVALFYGTVSVSFAIADALLRGFDVFDAGVYFQNLSPDILMMEPARMGLAAT